MEKNLVHSEQILSNVASNLEFILDELGIEYKKKGNDYICMCPIHNSNQYKCYINIKNGLPKWRCYTRNCHNEIGRSFINFVAAIRHSTYRETINWLQNKVGYNEDINFAYIQKRKEIQQYSSLEKKKIDFSENIISNLVIPSQYFLGRGFSKEILIKYQVGLFNKEYHLLNQRSVIPIRDKDSQLIGATGRTQFEKCNNCELFHNPSNQCPYEYSLAYAKWIFTQGFMADEYFFNEWTLEVPKTLILVEGCGDCLKLVQAGYKNALALFGVSLSETKLLKLIKMGVMDIVLLLDNDEAGLKSKQILHKKLAKSFNIIEPAYSGKDIGDLSEKQIINTLTNYGVVI